MQSNAQLANNGNLHSAKKQKSEDLNATAKSWPEFQVIFLGKHTKANISGDADNDEGDDDDGVGDDDDDDDNDDDGDDNADSHVTLSLKVGLASI